MVVATALVAALAAALGPVDTFGTKGSGDGQFRFPSDIALDSAGNIYVADQDNQRIQKLAPDGRLLAKLGSGSLEEGQTAPGSFDDPSGVGVDAAGNIWVVENDNMRLQKLAPDGSPLLVFGGDAGFMGPRQLALAPGGDVYVTDEGGVVFRFASNGAFLGSFGQGRLETPRGIAVDRDGNVYVADRDRFRVDVFSPGGDWLRSVSRPLRLGALYALDVTIDGSGNLWVLTDGDGLMKFSPFGSVLGRVSVPGERPAPDAYGVVAEPGGRVLVADTQLGRILRYGRVGALSSLLVSRDGTVTYVLRAPARVRFTVQRRVRGRYRRLRSFRRRGSDGYNAFQLRLPAGRYRLVAKTPGTPPLTKRFRLPRSV